MNVGVDTGGTFTDLVVIEDEGIRIRKVPSTPDDPARAVLAGLSALLGPEALAEVRIIHGSTVATNALLERKGARTTLVTTAGFEDVIEIGRQARPEIYDLAVTRPEPLVPPERRVGVAERVDERGGIVTALADIEIERALEGVRSSGAEAVAICLLHSYANPEHEKRLAEALRSRALFVSASHEVLPEFREYERTSTTAVNAYVGPVMSRYLGRLGASLDADRVRIMASNGGVLPIETASRLAVHTILSGPAGGAVGGFEVGRRAGHEHVITFDMGGTSTDVSLCAGALSRTSEAEIGGLPIRVPVIDIHTVGAGGGSIAFRDPGGALRVGPDSAGADPGPICYGQGGRRLTVTDAHVFLGRLPADHFLGGARTLEISGVQGALEELAAGLGLEPRALAEGILRVADTTMERAIRVISLERGFDPRDFTLVCFGGAGGLHAADLARSLGIPRVLVPPGAGTLSALGMLMADPVRDFSRTIMVETERLEPEALERELAALEANGRDELLAEGLSEESLRFERLVEMRYVGQGFELPVAVDPGGGMDPWDGPDSLTEDRPGARDPSSTPGGGMTSGEIVSSANYSREGRDNVGDETRLTLTERLAVAFHEAHERRYGYADPARRTEIVTIRVRAGGITPKPGLRRSPPGSEDPADAVLGTRSVVYGESAHEARLLERERLVPGNAFDGPAVVVEYSTTTFVPPGATCRVDEFGNLLLRPQ